MWSVVEFRESSKVSYEAVPNCWIEERIGKAASNYCTRFPPNELEKYWKKFIEGQFVPNSDWPTYPITLKVQNLGMY